MSALDVSVQASVLNLLDDLQAHSDSALLLISHDLAVVGYLADVVAVIYAGRLMQVSSAAALLEPPYHPYTEALLSAAPSIDPDAAVAAVRLAEDVRNPPEVSAGCPFYARCPRQVGAICATRTPPWQTGEPGTRIYCHIPLDELRRAQARSSRVG